MQTRINQTTEEASLAGHLVVSGKAPRRKPAKRAAAGGIVRYDDQLDSCQSGKLCEPLPYEDDDAGRVPPTPQGDSLRAALAWLDGGEAAVSGSDGESRAERATREGRALWRKAKEAGNCLSPDDYLSKIHGGGQEHRVWYDKRTGRYFKATHAGRYGWWYAAMNVRFNKRTQEDELYIGTGDALPSEYLDRLILQNGVFADDIRIEGFAIEREGLVILTSQRFIKGKRAAPADILAVMDLLGYVRIPGLPANSEDCFSFYDQAARIAAFDAHAGNFIKVKSGEVVPIDLVMVRADDAMHDYLCRRIDAVKPLDS